MIRVFSSKFSAEPYETFVGGGMSVAEWLASNVPSYTPGMEVQFSARLNGQVVPVHLWGAVTFEPSDTLDFTIEPKGTELFFGALFLAAATLMTPKIPKVSSAATGEGKDLNEASIKGNKVKLNDPIADIAGYRKVYPSYLSPPRRYFAGPRDQRMEMLVCVGLGDMSFETDKILIGDTPLISLGPDAEFSIYGPGQDVSGDPRSWWWHDVVEVGSSSNGASGLELTESTTLTNGFQASVIQYNAKTVAIPNGAGLFPEDWSAGLIVRIDNPYVYEFIDGGPGNADIIRGDNLNMLRPVVGQLIEISGTNAGYYTVATYVPGVPASGPTPAIPPQMTLKFDNGTPVSELTLGTIATTIGPRLLRYRITVFSTSQITVDRLTASGSTDSTWPGFNFLQTANSVIVLDRSTREGGYRGPFAMCPEGEKTNLLEIDVFCPSGLLGLGREGQEYEVFTFYQFEYRDMDISGDWTVLNFQKAGNSFDAVGFTDRIALPYAMRPEGRIKKVYTQQVERENEVNNDTVWYGARSMLPSKASYPNATVATFMVRGGDRLSAVSESQVSMQATRILPVRRDGAWQPPEPTRDIAPYALYLLKQVGYVDDDFDLAEWDRLDAVWRARGDTYDNVHSTTSTVQAILQDCLAAGFAEITVYRGRLRPVRDEPQDTFAALYTPAAMMADGMLQIQFESVQPGDYDGVDVEYTDQRTWQVATVPCDLPGDARTRVMKIQANGVTDRDKAYQQGMRQRRALKYRRKSFAWATEMSAFNSNYLDFVQVAGDVPGYAQSALLTGYDSANLLIAVGEVFDWSVGTAPFQLSVRRPDGTNSGPYVVERVDDYRLRLDRPLDFPVVVDGSIEPPHVLFGIGWPVQITSIEPNGTEDCRVQARIYDERVYLSDNDPAPV